MSQYEEELSNHLYNELDDQLDDIHSIMPNTYSTITESNNIPEEGIIVYGKSNGKLVYFKIYSYPEQEQEAKAQFNRIMNDETIDEYWMMDIETFSSKLSMQN